MARLIGTLVAVLVVYLASSYMALDWSPLNYSDAGRICFASCVVFAGLSTATCPFWSFMEEKR